MSRSAAGQAYVRWRHCCGCVGRAATAVEWPCRYPGKGVGIVVGERLEGIEVLARCHRAVAHLRAIRKRGIAHAHFPVEVRAGVGIARPEGRAIVALVAYDISRIDVLAWRDHYVARSCRAVAHVGVKGVGVAPVASYVVAIVYSNLATITVAYVLRESHGARGCCIHRVAPRYTPARNIHVVECIAD